MATRTTAEWLELLGDSSVPTMVVNTLEGLLEDPQLQATGFWKLCEHPTEGTLRMPDMPVTFSESPGSIERLAPRLGEHSVEVLEEAGLSRAQIDRMIDEGVTKVAD